MADSLCFGDGVLGHREADGWLVDGVGSLLDKWSSSTLYFSAIVSVLGEHKSSTASSLKPRYCNLEKKFFCVVIVCGKIFSLLSGNIVSCPASFPSSRKGESGD